MVEQCCHHKGTSLTPSWGLSAGSLYFLLPQSKAIHLRLTGYSKLSQGVSLNTNVCQSYLFYTNKLSRMYLAFGPMTARDRHQLPVTEQEQVG